MTLPPLKKKALLACGTLNPRPEAVTSERFTQPFFDPHDGVQVKYEMLRAQRVEGLSVTEACRQFGFSRERFYQLREAFTQRGFSALVPAKRGRKGPTKLKGELLAFAQQQQRETPEIDPGRLATLIAERFGVVVHRTTVLRALKKKASNARLAPSDPELGLASADDPVQSLYETLRGEALAEPASPSALLQRVCQSGVASLVAGTGDTVPFLLTAQSVPRSPWSGPRDGHREALYQVYEFLTQEVSDDANRPVCSRVQRAPSESPDDRLSA